MKSHGKTHELSTSQRNELKNLFTQLDSDGTGMVSIEELYEPLLSLGLVSNKAQVEQLVQYISAKKGGVFQFEEFLKIFYNTPKAATRTSGKLESILTTVAGNMKEFQKNDLPFRISVSTKRRKLMMQAYVSDNQADKEIGMRVINAFASEVNSSVSPTKIQRLYDRRITEFNDSKNVKNSKLQPLRISDSFLNYKPPVSSNAKTFVNRRKLNISGFLSSKG